MSFLVVGYYTTGTIYEKEATRLITSLLNFSIPYFIQPVQNLGDWYRNTQYKPQFIYEMLEKFEPRSLVYVDVDAEFLSFPDLFTELDARPDVDIGVHYLDHAKRGRPKSGAEMLSGTIFLKNSGTTKEIVRRWRDKCAQGGTLWDQVALFGILKEFPHYVLPEEYCTIFDYMSDVERPVIKHYQASRQVKRGGLEPPAGQPRVLTRPPARAVKTSMNGTVKLSRKYK